MARAGVIGLSLLATADITWLALLTLYIIKWLNSRPCALAEWHHPIESCSVDPVFSRTLLVSISLLAYVPNLAWSLAFLGWSGHTVFALWSTGVLWQGLRQNSQSTAVLILPQVTGHFISAIAAATFGYSDLAALFLGAGRSPGFLSKR
jgi:tellurite resistance protein